MIPLQVHITSGPQAGTRLQLTQTPVSFGRSPENTLVLDVNTVSRNHGELRFEEDGQWWLVNLSQNGTRVGRKRITKKPRALADGDSISIGDEEVFKVYYVGDATAESPAPVSDEGEPALQPESAAPGTGTRNRSKLWLFLGIWFALCIGLFILFATTCKSPGNGDGPAQKLERFETVDEVHKVLRREVARNTPSDYYYSDHIKRAREAYNTREDRYLYDAYDYYRAAASYLPAGQELPAEDRQNYNQVLDELAELIHERLDHVINLYSTSSYEQALREIDELRQYYPADQGDNELVDTILGLRERITRAMG